MSQEEDNLPESISFSESRKIFQNKLKQERQAKKVKRRQLHDSAKVITKENGQVDGREQDESSRVEKVKDEKLQGDKNVQEEEVEPMKEVFQAAANSRKLSLFGTKKLRPKKVKKMVRDKKAVNSNKEFMSFTDNAELSRQLGCKEDPLEFLKNHFYGNRLKRSVETNANRSWKKHRLRVSQ